MKKALIIMGAVYTVSYIGVLVYMIAAPESYGRLTGKMLVGIFEGMAKLEGGETNETDR